jgi:hypothetical protein
MKFLAIDVEGHGANASIAALVHDAVWNSFLLAVPTNDEQNLVFKDASFFFLRCSDGRKGGSKTIRSQLDV